MTSWCMVEEGRFGKFEDSNEAADRSRTDLVEKEVSFPREGSEILGSHGV